jgi:hypothetical protein
LPPVLNMFTLEFRFNAISNNAAVPVPLSTTPGPSVTESRCAPAITTLSGRPPGVSASTLLVDRVSEIIDVETWATTELDAL